jgi:hypothetical protein
MLDEEQVRAAVALMRELGIVEFHTGGNVLVLGPGAVPERRAAPTVKLPAVGETWTQAQIDSIRSTRPEVARSIEALQKEDAQPDEGPPLGPPAIPDASAPPGSAEWWAAFHLKHGRDPTPAEMSAAARGPGVTGQAAEVVSMAARTATGQGIYACSSCGCGVLAPGMCSACHDNGGKPPPPMFTVKPGVPGAIDVELVTGATSGFTTEEGEWAGMHGGGAKGLFIKAPPPAQRVKHLYPWACAEDACDDCDEESES